jgi:hypothetical protein
MIQLRLHQLRISPTNVIGVVDLEELHFKLGDRRPFHLWVSHWRHLHCLRKYRDGEQVFHRWGEMKKTFVVPEMAKKILMMSSGRVAEEYQLYLLDPQKEIFPNDPYAPLQSLWWA